LPATVLLFDLPKMLEDIIFAVLKDRREFHVLCCAADATGPTAAAMRVGASVVILSHPTPEDLAALDPDLMRATTIALLALNPNGSSVCLHALLPRMSRIDDVSAARLTAVVAAAALQGTT
jgi:hypothetical protein